MILILQQYNLFLNVIRYDEDVNTCPFVFDSFLDWYKTQEIFHKVVLQEPLCDKGVDAFLLTLKFVFRSFVTNKMLEKFDDVVVFSNDDVDLNDIYSDIVTLFSDGTGINTIS